MATFAEGLRGGVCSIWESAPGRFLRVEPGDPLSNPSTPAFFDMMNNYCADEPGFVPPQASAPFAGGQCPVFYDVTTTWTVTRNATQQQFTAGGTGRYLGPVRNAGTQVIAGGIAGYLSTGNGTVAATDIFLTSEWSDFSWGVVNVVRVDGQADNCGDPPLGFPGEPQPGDEDGIDIVVPIEVAPNVSVNVDVEVVPDVTNVRVPIIVNNRIVADINLGGINFNVGVGGGSPPTDLSPVLDAIADTQGQLETARGDIISGQQRTDMEVNENQALIEQVVTIVETIFDAVARIGIPESLSVPQSGDVCETDIVVPDSIFNALFILSDQLRLMRQINCRIDVPRTLIGEFVSTLEERVAVFTLPSETRIVEIEVTNLELPERVSAYFVSSVEGINARFGFCNLAYSRGGGTWIEGLPQQIWSRRTVVQVPDGVLGQQLRCLIEPEISIAVYDSGVR
jgi:hypothetical protein